MTENEILTKREKRVYVNPFYVIRLHRLFRTNDGPRLINKEKWISTNERMIDEIGKRAWLQLLLEALEGKFI